MSAVNCASCPFLLLRTRSRALAHIPARVGACCISADFPLAAPLPHRSAAGCPNIVRRFPGTTGAVDFPSSFVSSSPGASRCGLGCLPPQTTTDLPVPAQVDFGACMGSLTERGSAMPRDHVGVAFRLSPRRRHPEVPKAHTSGHGISRLNTPAAPHPLPTLRPRPCERRRTARMPVRFAYFFTVGLFHSFSTCRLTRRTEDNAPECTTTSWNGNDCVPAPWGPHVKRFCGDATEKGFRPRTVALKVRQAARSSDTAWTARVHCRRGRRASR